MKLNTLVGVTNIYLGSLFIKKWDRRVRSLFKLGCVYSVRLSGLDMLNKANARSLELVIPFI